MPKPLADPTLASSTKRPGRNGHGWLQSGNPKSKGRTPSWIREQLRQGLAAAMPTIRHALATRTDPKTGDVLTWSDYAKLVDVAGRLSMPAQQELSGDAPFKIVLQGPGGDYYEPDTIDQPTSPLALPGPR